MQLDEGAADFSTNDFAGWAGPISLAVGAEGRREAVTGNVPVQYDPTYGNYWKYGNYVATKYNVRFPGWNGYQSTQFERFDYGGKSDFYANPGDTVSVQGCRERLFGSICQSWAVLTVPWW